VFAPTGTCSPTTHLISHTEPAAKEAAGYGETAEGIKGSLHKNGSPDS
jgi:hypothetical protein